MGLDARPRASDYTGSTVQRDSLDSPAVAAAMFGNRDRTFYASSTPARRRLMSAGLTKANHPRRTTPASSALAKMEDHLGPKPVVESRGAPARRGQVPTIWWQPPTPNAYLLEAARRGEDKQGPRVADFCASNRRVDDDDDCAAPRYQDARNLLKGAVHVADEFAQDAGRASWHACVGGTHRAKGSALRLCRLDIHAGRLCADVLGAKTPHALHAVPHPDEGELRRPLVVRLNSLGREVKLQARE